MKSVNPLSDWTPRAIVPDWNPVPVSKAEGDGYNPYRDADGKFASGPGGGGGKGKEKPPSKKRPASKPKKEPKKKLTRDDALLHVEEAAKQYPAWRGYDEHRELYGNVNFEGFGKNQIHKITTHLTELDSRCKKLGIPPIRGVHPISYAGGSKYAGAAMSDGILYVNSETYTPRPGWERKEKRERLRVNLEGAIESYKSGAYQGKVTEAQAKQYIAIFQRELDANNKRKTGDGDMWKPGDPLNLRPHTADEYCSDRQKQILDHEFGHHIHQQCKQTEKIYKQPGAPMLFRIQQLALSNAFRFNVDERRWIPRDESRTMFPTRYSETNPQEWFAECYSLWVNDRQDLVPECLHDLMKEVSP